MTTHKGVRCRSSDGVRDAETWPTKTPPKAEAQERKAIQGEHKSKGSTSFNFGKNRTDASVEDSELGELVASYPADEYDGYFFDETIYIYRRSVPDPAPTQDSATSYSERLKAVAKKYRDHVWW